MDQPVWTPEEQDAWKLPEKITVSEWADRERIVSPLVSPESGPWKTSRVPYMRAIMDAFSDPLVEEITVMASTQVAKTEALHNMLGYAIDQDQGPALVVLPTEDLAESTSVNRLKPMIEGSPALAAHLRDNKDDFTKLEYRLKDMVVYFAGANSPSALSSRAIRYLLLDEVDKYPRFSGKEADPIKLAAERTKNFWNKKIVKVSTPTTKDGFIYREYLRSDRERYHMPCPHCGGFQSLKFTQIKWPKKERNPDKIKSDGLARYECELCSHNITDAEKLRMLPEGVWIPEGWTVDENGRLNGYIRTPHRGFWLSSLYSPWLKWADVAAEWLASYKRVELRMNFVNSWLAEIHEEKVEDTGTVSVSGLISEYPEGFLPDPVMVLTAGVDVQKDHAYYAIRGWGLNEESFLIKAGRVWTWAELADVLFLTQYEHATQEPLSVRLACIDSGYRTDEVYEFVRKWREVARPIKGQQTLAGIPYRSTRIDRNPRTGEVMKGGLLLWHVDTGHYKDKIARLSSLTPGDPSQWHIHGNPAQAYLDHFRSEYKVKEVVNRKTGAERIYWKPRPGVASNHWWDCEVYAVAAADMLRVAYMRADVADQADRPQRKAPSAASGARQEGASWMGKRSGWMR